MIRSLLLFIGFLLGCLSPSHAQALESKHKVNITVFEKGFNTTVYNAYVNLYIEEELLETYTTDLLGRVQFDNLLSGIYTITVDAEGYILSSVTVDLSTPDFEQDVEIYLKRKKEIDTKEKKLEEESEGIFTLYDMASPPPMSTTRASSTASYVSKPELPSSGQVTAGEWNDLHNWKDWLDLLEDEKYNEMTSHWGIFPVHRFSTIVLDRSNNPISMALVKLIDVNGNVLWQTFTDHTGKAELWQDVFQKGSEADKIEVSKGRLFSTLDDLLRIDKGSNKIILNAKCQDEIPVDIVFTVDATSSMSDEIDYLKAELLDVIDRVKRKTTDVDLRMGSVFYRDINDDYLTRNTPLDKEIEKTISFVRNQYADGGGDFPEAVHSAMQEAHAFDWRPGALKLHFLLLDAPPHEDEETLVAVRREIRKAAEKGIRLIPITASGINRETEFLMKFMAILTNGTYAFITDDSGIGHTHLDPVVEDYEVEKLNDLMVRIISEMISVQSCEKQKLQVSVIDQEITVFPNPATNFVTVKSKAKPDKITLTSNSGMIIKTMTPNGKETRIELNELVSGVYTVTVFTGKSISSKRVIVVK